MIQIRPEKVKKGQKWAKMHPKVADIDPNDKNSQRWSKLVQKHQKIGPL